MLDTASQNLAQHITWLLNFLAHLGKDFGFAGKWGMLLVIFVAGIFGALWFFESHFVIDKSLRSAQLVKEKWSLRFFQRARQRRWAMGYFLAADHQKFIILISVSILLLSLLRALGASFSTEFSRAGALISIVGLWSAIASYMEECAIQERWDLLAGYAAPENREAIQSHAKRPIRRAQLKATITSVVIALTGNLIWGFGDQILSCGVLHPLHIFDNDTVNCIK